MHFLLHHRILCNSAQRPELLCSALRGAGTWVSPHSPHRHTDYNMGVPAPGMYHGTTEEIKVPVMEIYLTVCEKGLGHWFLSVLVV